MFRVKKAAGREGIVAILPVLLVAVILVLGLTSVSLKKGSLIRNSSKVLSESNDGGSGSSNSGKDGGEIKSSESSGSSSNESTSGSAGNSIGNSITSPRPSEKPGSESETEIKHDKVKEEVKPEVEDKNKLENEVETETGKIDEEKALDEAVKDGEIDSSLSAEVHKDEAKAEFDVQGTEKQKFLGLFDVAIPKMVRISAENGKVLEVSQSLLSRILDLLSI